MQFMQNWEAALMHSCIVILYYHSHGKIFSNRFFKRLLGSFAATYELGHVIGRD